MISLRYVTTLLVLTSLFQVTHASAPADSCAKQLPPALALELRHAFPGFRPPVVTDNLADDVQRSKKNGGSECLGVVVSAFSGTREPGIAIILTAEKGDGFVLAVALPKGKTWQVTELFREKEGRSRQYIEPTAAGHYDHVESYDPDPSKGELSSLDCPQPGFLTGTTEATGDVFCLVNGQWLYVPIID